MPIEKVLTKIQEQIKELAPTLELFVEHTIHPSVKDCEKLQKQMQELQEYLSVYKFGMFDSEISPSYKIHVKVSEKEQEAPAKSAKEPVKETKHENREAEKAGDKNSSASKKPLAIGVNDKFRFINELFSQNSSEYHIALEQLNNLTSWYETEIYLNSLKSVYDWRDSQEVVKYFFSILKKRFD